MEGNRIKVVEIRGYISNLGKLLEIENYQPMIEYVLFWDHTLFSL